MGWELALWVGLCFFRRDFVPLCKLWLILVVKELFLMILLSDMSNLALINKLRSSLSLSMWELGRKQRETKTNQSSFSSFSVLWIFFELLFKLYFMCFLFPFHIPWKHQRTTCPLVSPGGINWEHHQLNEIIIDWPIYEQCSHTMPPKISRKPQAL